jgi:hypothetical protein
VCKNGWQSVTRVGQRILTYHRGLCLPQSTTKFSRSYGLEVNPGAKVERFVRLEMTDNINVFESVLSSNPYT